MTARGFRLRHRRRKARRRAESLANFRFVLEKYEGRTMSHKKLVIEDRIDRATFRAMLERGCACPEEPQPGDIVVCV